MKILCLQERTEIALELNESDLRNGRSINTRNFRPRADSTNLTNVIKPNQNTFGNEIGKGSKKRNLMVLMNKNILFLTRRTGKNRFLIPREGEKVLTPREG